MYIEISNVKDYIKALKELKKDCTIEEEERCNISKAITTGYKISKMYGADVKLSGKFHSIVGTKVYEMDYFIYIEIDK